MAPHSHWALVTLYPQGQSSWELPGTAKGDAVQNNFWPNVEEPFGSLTHCKRTGWTQVEAQQGSEALCWGWEGTLVWEPGHRGHPPASGSHPPAHPQQQEAQKRQDSPCLPLPAVKPELSWQGFFHSSTYSVSLSAFCTSWERKECQGWS